MQGKQVRTQPSEQAKKTGQEAGQYNWLGTWLDGSLATTLTRPELGTAQPQLFFSFLTFFDSLFYGTNSKTPLTKEVTKTDAE